MNHPNSIYSPRYNYYEQHPLKKGSSAADQLLEHDVQSKAVVPIEQQVNVQLTQQQFDALVIWTFNTGGGNYTHPKVPVAQRGGLAASAALQSMNTCQMSAVPSDFTHYDHVNGQVSCGLYRRDMVSGEIWISDAYTVPRDAFTCPTGSVK
jgi:GH24 family phage-related lysozyme (muramidase)